LISSVDVLPSTCRTFYYVLNVQLFLQPQFTENGVDFVHWNAANYLWYVVLHT
jgi:hypothetical protein